MYQTTCTCTPTTRLLIVHVYGLGFVANLVTCTYVLVAIDSNLLFLFYVVDLSNLIILVSPVVFCGVTD